MNDLWLILYISLTVMISWAIYVAYQMWRIGQSCPYWNPPSCPFCHVPLYMDVEAMETEYGADWQRNEDPDWLFFCPQCGEQGTYEEIRRVQNIIRSH